jgi:hypothetical protein
VLPDRMRKSSVETREIDANNCVRLPLQRQAEQLRKDTPKFEVISQYLGDASDRVGSHIQRKVNARGGHLWAAGAKKAWLQACVQWLIIPRRMFRSVVQFEANCPDQFSGENVAAGLACYHHESFRLHARNQSTTE